MVARKYPRFDGFTKNFFWNYWAMIRTNISKVVEDSISTKIILQAFNSTFLTLIPKEDKANSLDKFRSISLCNVMYKIICKVITNRIKLIMCHTTLDE